MNMDDVHVGEPHFVQVVEVEFSEDVTEFPVEHDGTILLTTLQAQFPASVSLKYRNPSGKAWRAVRFADGKLHAPLGGWGDAIYMLTVKAGNLLRVI